VLQQKEQQKKIEASKVKSKIDILTIDARKIANSLSALDHRLFKAITPRECLNKVRINSKVSLILILTLIA
jgi:hypothetical protein